MKKKIKEESEILKDELERKLYCIKRNDFLYDDDFKKVYNFEFSLNLDDGSGGKFIKLDKNIYFLSEESRIMNFIINNETYQRFIISHIYLKNIFKELKIEYYSIKGDKLEDSLVSEISDTEIINIFKDINIVNIYKINTGCDKIIDKFNNRYPEKMELISNLSLNAKFYYPNNSDDKIDFSIINKLYSENILSFLFEELQNILYLIGPKGSSKSIFLMLKSFMINIMQFPTLYINYRKLKVLELKERKKIFKNEIIYLFFKENILKEFYKQKYHRIISTNENLMFCLKEFIKCLINIYENTFTNKIILIIDNFDDDNNLIYEELEKIIELSKNNSSELKLIISGSSKFLFNKYKMFLEKKNLSEKIDKQILINYDIKIKTNIDNEFKSLPAFYFRKNINDENIENILLTEEMNYCNKFNVFGMHYSLMNDNNKIDINDLLENFEILPLDYLNFKINDNNYVTFNFHNELFKKAIKNKIKFKIKLNSLQFLLKEVNNDQIINGIFEEKLLALFISYNKLNLINFDIKENNLLEVKELIGFKNSLYSITNKNIDIGNPIIITQENFKGPFYDIIIINGKIENRTIYSAFMTQIGINKTKEQIETILKDFRENNKKYLKGIKQFLGDNINISEIVLLFIFNKEHQQILNFNNEKINISGSKYCFQNQIKFYSYSILDNYLYWTPDLKRY